MTPTQNEKTTPLTKKENWKNDDIKFSFNFLEDVGGRKRNAHLLTCIKKELSTSKNIRPFQGHWNVGE